jgi:hypothetical protein
MVIPFIPSPRNVQPAIVPFVPFLDLNAITARAGQREPLHCDALGTVIVISGASNVETIVSPFPPSQA